MSQPAQRPPFAATRKALAELDGLLPGSVVVRLMRCGKRGTSTGPFIPSGSGAPSRAQLLAAGSVTHVVRPVHVSVPEE